MAADDKDVIEAMPCDDGGQLCPILRQKCLGERCAWHLTYANDVRGCSATHMADALVEVAYQMTLT